MSEITPTFKASPDLFRWADREGIHIEWLHEWRIERPARRKPHHDYMASAIMILRADRELPLEQCFEYSLRNDIWQAVTAFGYKPDGTAHHRTLMWPIEISAFAQSPEEFLASRRLKPDTPLAEGFTAVGDPEPNGGL